MKILFAVSLLAALGLTLGGCQSSSAPVVRGKVVVNFVEPDKFADVKSSFVGSTDEGYLSELRRFLEDQAGRPFMVVGDTAWSIVARP